jgi:hypothetical protein
MRDVLRIFAGELWTVSENARQRFGLYWMRCGKDAGFTDEPDTINGGGNSGFQALHLAATFGARKIILLGYDMQRTGGELHWHGKHWGGLPSGNGFPSWIRNFGPLATDLRRRGIDVINATRETALKCFPRQTLEEVLEQCPINTTDRTYDDAERLTVPA